MPPNSSSCLLLLLLLVGAVAAIDINYFKSASSPYSQSTFSLGYCPTGATVTAVINQYGANNPFRVLLWSPGQFYPSAAPAQSQTMAGSTYYTSAALNLPGEWKISVLPADPTADMFRFNIVLQVNNASVGSYTDVSRYYRLFTLYHKGQGTYQVSLTLASGLISEAKLRLYGPLPNLGFSGGSLVGEGTGGSDPNSLVLEYHSNGKEFYYLIVESTDYLMSSTQFMGVKFKTDQYQCPYSNQVADYNGVFQGCSTIVPTYGFPCINFDNAINSCLACYPPWIANDQGVCVQDTSCPQGKYYTYGQCKDVIDNCDKYDNFGGYCHSCKQGYNLQVQANGNQSCDPSNPVCAPNQYLLGKVCYNYVPNCANFQSSSGTCLICTQGFTLQSNSCVQIIQTVIQCPLGQTPLNGICVLIDEFCIFYNPDNSCMLCAKGYKLQEKKCNKIICKNRQYSQSGICQDVSPMCATYDPIYGNCLTCIGLYYLQQDGSCLQGLPSQMSKANPNSACPTGYYMRQGTCVQSNPLCGTYDLNSGVCTTCVSSDYFLNQLGACLLIKEFCGYRTYFANANCLPVSVLCDDYDSTTGYCLSCRDNTVLTQDGRCIFNETCGAREYQTSNGSCLKVSEKCEQYDPANGQCLSCIKEHELNKGGFCCYKLNYLRDPSCKPFFADNCASQHPKFGYCQACKLGYTLTSVYSRCTPL